MYVPDALVFTECQEIKKKEERKKKNDLTPKYLVDKILSM